MTSTSSSPPNRWLAFAIILSATLLGVLDFLIVNLALPSIKRTTGASDAQVQLTVAAYGLSFAVCLITGGRLGDLYGRKRIFQIGMAGFTFASVLCGCSQSGAQLVAFRVVQGVFAALMSPQVLATVQVMFVGRERDLATSYTGAVVGIGSLLGNVVGGFLVSANLFGLEWRPVFFVNVPIGLTALLLSSIYLQESRASVAKKLDIPGALLSGLALFAFIFPISEGRERGFPLWTWAMMGASFLIAWGWLRFERALEARGGAPLVAMELFESKGYGRGLLSILLLAAGLNSTSFMIGQFLQRGLGQSPRQAGVIVAALSLSFFLSSLASAPLVGRWGHKTLLLGISILQVGQLLIVGATLALRGQFPPALMMPILFVYGLGQGLTLPQVTRRTMNAVGTTNAGAASGVLSTTQQIAASLSVSVIGGLFFAIADPGGHGTRNSWALGTGIAFGVNFVLVLIARLLVARNMGEVTEIPTQNLGTTALEA